MQPGSDRVARIIAAAAAVLAAPVGKRDADAAEELATELTNRLEALTGDQLFADLPAALRESELQALQITLSIYEAGLPAAGRSTAAPGRAFHTAAVQFSATALVAAKAAGGASGVRRRKSAEIANVSNARVPYGMAQRRLSAEEGLLGELDLAIGAHRLPDRFLALFLDARPEGAAWFDAFSLYVAWHIRSDKGLQAALAQAALPALSKAGLDVPGLLALLFQGAKETALRLEARLGEAEAGLAEAGERANREISVYLDRLPVEIAKVRGVPTAALRSVAAAQRGGDGDIGCFEERLNEQAGRLHMLLATLSNPPGAAGGEAGIRQRALAHLREGRLGEAAAVLKGWNGSTEGAMAEAAALALACRWPEAKAQLDRAIELVRPQNREQAFDAACELARVLAEEGGVVSHGLAVEISETVLAAAPGDLDAARRADIAMRMAASALLVARGPSQLKSLSAVSEWLAVLSADAVRRFSPLQKAVLARVRGDVELALAGHGADRVREAAAAYKDGLQLAGAAHNPRLLSELHVRLGDLTLQQALKAPPAEMQRLRREALEAFQAAQVPRLRTRDPIWWVEVKVRIAEASLAIGSYGGSDPDMLRSGVIAAKAALRLLAPEIMAERVARVLGVLGDLFAALARAEAAPRWRVHALAAYDEALAATDREALAGLWSNLQVRIAGVLAPEGEEATTDDLEQAVAHYRAALSVLTSNAPRYPRVQRLLADALSASGRRRFDLVQLDEAASAYRSVLGSLTLAAAPGHWCQAWIGLTLTERERARLRHDASPLTPLIAELEAAGQRVGKSGQPWMVAAIGKAIADCREDARRLAKDDPVEALSDPVRKVAMILRRG